jgi:hypothetical protein
MVLDWEKYEALWVLLKEGLISFFWLYSWRNHDCLLCLDLLHDGLLDFDGVNDWRVSIERNILFSRGLQVELLCWGGTHLETFNGRGSLCKEAMVSKVDARRRRRVAMKVLTILEGVT